MKLVKRKPRDVYATWHRFAVLGCNLLVDFESESGGVVRLRRGFRCECCVRGADVSAAFERLLPVVSSAALESLIATPHSRISARYVGIEDGPLGDELTAGVFWSGLNLHREIPILSDVLYGLESVITAILQTLRGHRI